MIGLTGMDYEGDTPIYIDSGEKPEFDFLFCPLCGKSLTTLEEDDNNGMHLR